MIRIAYIIDHLRVGGAQRHLLEVVRGLDRTRYAAEMWTATTEPGDLGTVFEKCGVPVRSFRIDSTMMSPRTIVAARDAARDLRRRGVHVIHGYLFEGNFLAALVGTMGRFPVTLVSKRSLDRYRRLDHRIAAWLSNWRADRVLVNAEAVRDLVVEHERCPRRKITLIPNGVALPAALGAPHDEGTRVPDAAPLVGMVGRLSWKKGYEYALEAFATVHEHLPRVRFQIVGDGPLRAELEAHAERLGLGAAVEFLGQRRDVPSLMRNFDCYVLSSVIEGMPNALLEAMALGRPVVTTDAGGSREVVVDGESGFVVPIRSAPALAEGIQRILADKALAARLGRAGEERVRRHFSLEAMLNALDALYLSELERAGVSPLDAPLVDRVPESLATPHSPDGRALGAAGRGPAS